MERISDTSMSETTTSYQGLSRFCFCFNLRKYRTSCCFGCFTLRATIYIFGIFDIISGFLEFFILFTHFDINMFNRPYCWAALSKTINIATGITAIIGMSGANKTDPKKVAVYYYGKVIQVIGSTGFHVLYVIEMCNEYFCDPGSNFGLLLGTTLNVALLIYEALIFYSYVNLVCQGKSVLANNGREVVEAMELYRRQAGVLDLNPYPGVVVGAVLQPSAVEVQGRIETAESKPAQITST